MTQTSFPKPSCPATLPLEVWLDMTDRAEVGREAFFRGRVKEYEIFRGAVNNLRAGQIGGDTMIFQGTPGVGKTALMQECMEAVRRHSTQDDPWVVVDIRPGVLGSPVAVVKQLVEAVNEERERLSKDSGFIFAFFKNSWKWTKKLYQELSIRGIGIMGFSVGGGSRSDGGRKPDTRATRAFLKAAPLLRKFHLVVMVDEAQNTPTNEFVRGVIECLHNPPREIPLVTAFFGLSDTQIILSECGLPKLPAERLVNMEALESQYATSAIRGVFDAYGFQGTSEDREAWIDSLAKLSQGFPQHIRCVSVAAARIIQEHNGHVMMAHLDEALMHGRKWMNVYYHGRLVAGSSRDWVYREMALAEKEKDGFLSVNDIESITKFVREKESQTLDEFMIKALHAGLLAPVQNSTSRYRIPIPSLGDYLRALPE